MATNFPTSLDSYTTKVDAVTDVLASHINNPQDAIVALETKVGVTGSAVTTTHDYKIAQLESGKAPLASPTLTGTVTIPTPFTLGATSVTATGAELNFSAGVTSAIQTQLNAKTPLTGGGASGTWGISITGNAATATNAAACTGNAATTSAFAIPAGDTINAITLAKGAVETPVIGTTYSTSEGHIIVSGDTFDAPGLSLTGTWICLGVITAVAALFRKVS